MKYLKRFKIYENENNDSSNNLEELKNEISVFNSKKVNLEKLITTNVGEDKKDISRNIEQIVGENRFLKKWSFIMKKIARVKEGELKLEYFDDLHKERKNNLNNVKKLSDPEDRKTQTEKLTNQIKDIEENVSDLKETIKELEESIEENKKQLNEDIKEIIENMKEIDTDIDNSI